MEFFQLSSWRWQSWSMYGKKVILVTSKINLCFFSIQIPARGERWDTLLASASNLRILLAHLLHDWKLEVVTFPGFLMDPLASCNYWRLRDSAVRQPQFPSWAFGEESNLLSTPAFSNPSFGWTTTPFAAREGVSPSSGLLALPDIGLRCFILTEYNITVS